MTKAGDFDLHLHMVELHNTGPSKQMTLASFLAYCSVTMGRPLQGQMVVLGNMSLGGNIVPAENMAEALQVGRDAGAKRVLLPMANAKDISTVPGELFTKYQVSFYSDPVDAAFKAMGED
jgi:ATP-dependent Lon protease